LKECLGRNKEKKREIPKWRLLWNWKGEKKKGNETGNLWSKKYASEKGVQLWNQKNNKVLSQTGQTVQKNAIKRGQNQCSHQDNHQGG